MSKSVGNNAIDKVFVTLTVLLFVFGVLFGLGFWGGIFPSLIFMLDFLWITILIMFIVSRANLSREGNLATDDTLEEIDEFLLEPTPETSYVIPSYCPFCHEPVILEEIDWLRPDAFSCRFCGKKIQVKLKHER